MLSPKWAAVQECYMSSQACTIYSTFTFLLLSLSLEYVYKKALLALKWDLHACFFIFHYKSLKLCLQQDFARIWFTVLGLPIRLCPCNSLHALHGLQAAHTPTTSAVNNTCQKSWHFVIIYLIILASTIWILGKKESCHTIWRSIYEGNSLLKHIALNCFAVSSHINKHKKLKSSGWFYILCL